MSWQGQISTMVRHLISDVDPSNYKYSARRLETTILVAAQLLTTETDLAHSYDINVEQCDLNQILQILQPRMMISYWSV